MGANVAEGKPWQPPALYICGHCGGFIMRVFSQRQLREALEYASAGGQALHLHRLAGPGAPVCFRRDLDAGKEIAHLFDQDATRLTSTARRLGVRVVVLERSGTDKQHIDLCGAPLRRALSIAKS